MTLLEMLNQPCTIVRRSSSATEADEYGNAAQVETTYDTVCSLQQRQRGEHDDVVGVGEWNLYLAPNAPIDSGDAVQVDGELYELTGPPWPAWDVGTGDVHHVEATVRRTAGSEA